MVPLEAVIQRLMGSRPVVTSEMTVKDISRINSERPEELVSLPQPAAAFCAVGNPDSFFELLRRTGINSVFTRSFQDHHQYTQADVDSLIQASRKAGAQSIITTAKDAVKLQQTKFELPCYVLNIEISLGEEDRIIQMVDAAAAA